MQARLAADSLTVPLLEGVEKSVEAQLLGHGADFCQGYNHRLRRHVLGLEKSHDRPVAVGLGSMPS